MARRRRKKCIQSSLHCYLFVLFPQSEYYFIEIARIKPVLSFLPSPTFSSTWFVPLRLQERSRGGQEVPQGVRSGAQGPVVHRLSLEKGLPALPRLKTVDGERESVRETWMDEWFKKIKKDFCQKEDINQGLRAIEKNNTSGFVFSFQATSILILTQSSLPG